MDANRTPLRVLGIGFDYQSIVASQTRGDFLARFVEIARHVDRLTRIIYCPAGARLAPIKVGEQAEVIFTNSRSKWHFYHDLFEIMRKIAGPDTFDVISAEDPLFAGIAGVLLRRKYHWPLNVQTFDSRINNPHWLRENKKNYLLNEIAKFVFKRADSVRVVAECTKKTLLAMGLRQRDIFVVPTIMDIRRFENVDGHGVRGQYLKKEHDQIILFVGRLSPEKNLPFLIRSFAAVRDAFPGALLLIVGGGPEQSCLEEMAAGLGLAGHVIFTGPVEYEDIPRYHSAADIFVLPSWHEGRANVLVEAALSRTAIIATDVGDARVCVADGQSGYVIKENDTAALTNSLTDLLADDEKRQRFAAAGYEHVVHYLEGVNDVRRLVEAWRGGRDEQSA